MGEKWIVLPVKYAGWDSIFTQRKQCFTLQVSKLRFFIPSFHRSLSSLYGRLLVHVTIEILKHFRLLRIMFWELFTMQSRDSRIYDSGLTERILFDGIIYWGFFIFISFIKTWSSLGI